jgi:hypothetical protein
MADDDKPEITIEELKAELARTKAQLKITRMKPEKNMTQNRKREIKKHRKKTRSLKLL